MRGRGQAPQSWKAELNRAIARSRRASVALSTDHRARDAVSRAAIRRQARRSPTSDTSRELYDLTQEICARAGFRLTRFPITRGPARNAGTISSIGAAHEYAGIGPGAHGRLNIGGARIATATEKRPETWLMRVESLGHGVIEDEPLTREERADEYLLMGLRLAEGIDPARIRDISGRAARSEAHRDPACGRRGRDDGARTPARDAGRLPGARRRGGRSGGVSNQVPVAE